MNVGSAENAGAIFSHSIHGDKKLIMKNKTLCHPERNEVKPICAGSTVVEQCMEQLPKDLNHCAK
jgi:hypothetical protein